MYAAIDGNDPNHDIAVEAFREIAASAEQAATHNYAVVETFTLVFQRLGVDAARSFVSEILPAIELGWVGRELHEEAIALAIAGPRTVSLVDRVSFAWMRRAGIDRALAFDDDFSREGFTLVPARPPSSG